MTAGTYGDARERRSTCAIRAIVNSAEFLKYLSNGGGELLHVQYNPAKQRLYLITQETGFIHILTIGNAANFATWWGFGCGPRRRDDLCEDRRLCWRRWRLDQRGQPSARALHRRI